MAISTSVLGVVLQNISVLFYIQSERTVL